MKIFRLKFFLPWDHWYYYSILILLYSMLCLKKNRTPITCWNNSNKLCLIIIMISWENRQKVLNIVMCYGLTIFHKTGYQLSRIMHPHIGHVRRLSFCVVRHQRSSRLTSGRPTAPTSTLLTTAFGAVYSSVYQKPVKDVDELKQRLVEVWSGLRQTVVDDAIDEWRRRLRASVWVKGQHFEHLL